MPQKACGCREELNMRTHAVDRRRLTKEGYLMLMTRSRGRLFNHDNEASIVVHFLSIMASGVIRPCQQDLETPILILTFNLT
jgi:hypothetical protein